MAASWLRPCAAVDWSSTDSFMFASLSPQNNPLGKLPAPHPQTPPPPPPPPPPPRGETPQTPPGTRAPGRAYSPDTEPAPYPPPPRIKTKNLKTTTRCVVVNRVKKGRKPPTPPPRSRGPGRPAPRPRPPPPPPGQHPNTAPNPPRPPAGVKLTMTKPNHPKRKKKKAPPPHLPRTLRHPPPAAGVGLPKFHHPSPFPPPRHPPTPLATRASWAHCKIYVSRNMTHE